jgi:site-specific recombinase XerD
MAQKEPDPDTDGIVFREVKCKGEKTRDVFIAAPGARAIEDYIEKERGNEAGHLFFAAPSLTTREKGKRGMKHLSRSGVWRILKRLAAKAMVSVEGIDNIPLSPHMLRHERAYSLKKSGFSDTDLAEELGHSGTGYVSLYTKRSDTARFKRLSKVG